MPRLRFTRNIQRHVECPPEAVTGATVREAVDRYFDLHPRARGYVLDEQSTLRKHIMVFVDGRPVGDRTGLGDRVEDDAVIDVMQALSGG